MSYEKYSNDEMIAQIQTMQSIQKRNPPSSDAWQFASRALAPMFEEMARRQKAELL